MFVVEPALSSLGLCLHATVFIYIIIEIGDKCKAYIWRVGVEEGVNENCGEFEHDFLRPMIMRSEYRVK